MLDGNKEDFIKKLNQNFITVLSYGNDGLIPMGEFVVKDIQKDEISSEYANGMSDFQLCNVILTKVDDENVQIVLPMTTFLTKYYQMSIANADKLSIGSDFSLSLQDIEQKAESKVISDETLKDLVDVETISLEESDADYLINGEVQSSNYSICPINLGKYRERIKEKLANKEEKKQPTISESYRQEGGFERSPYNES